MEAWREDIEEFRKLAAEELDGQGLKVLNYQEVDVPIKEWCLNIWHTKLDAIIVVCSRVEFIQDQTKEMIVNTIKKVIDTWEMNPK